eukprot:258747_1
MALVAVGTCHTIPMSLFYLLCIGIVIQFAFISNAYLQQLYVMHPVSLNLKSTFRANISDGSVTKINSIKLSASSWFCLSHIQRGTTSKVWSVIITNKTTSRMAAMKYSRNDLEHPDTCNNQSRIEYETLKQLYKYNSSLNFVPLLYEPELPLYQYFSPQNDTIAGCVRFMTQLNAVGTVTDLRQDFYNLRHATKSKIKRTIRRHFISKDPLQFIMTCYWEIVSVLNAIHSMGQHYNDFHPSQILIEAQTHRCYLIDFQTVLNLSNLHSMRDVRCFWQRCPARTYYPAWRSYKNETKNEDIAFQIEYEAFTMMFHLFVDVCGNMEKMNGNITIAHKLLDLNTLYKPWEKWEYSMSDNKKYFGRAYCQRQDIVALLRNIDSFDKLQCAKPSNMRLKHKFLAFLNIYEDECIKSDEKGMYKTY